MGVEVFQSQHLFTGGTHLAVQLQAVGGACLPGFLFVFFRLQALLLFLESLKVSVGSEKLLLLASVWKENQQLIENSVEILSQQLLAAFVVLDSRYYTLVNRKREFIKIQ